MHGKRWVKEDPRIAGYRPPGYRPPPRGQSPAATQYRRQPQTAARDREAWDLRACAGMTYRGIAELMGYRDRQAAHDAVKRAQWDRLQYRRDKAAPVPLQGRLPAPEIPVRHVKKTGMRACGHWLPAHAEAVSIKGKLHCLPCAHEYIARANMPSSRPLQSGKTR